TLTYGARWEVTPPPALRSAAPLALGTGTVAPGSIIGNGPAGAITPPAAAISALDQPIWSTRYNQFAPRLGAAYRLTPDGTFVLRAGGGIFYDLGFGSATDPVNGAPYNSWQGLTGALTPVSTLQSLRYGFARDLRVPLSVEWNFAIERQFAGK